MLEKEATGSEQAAACLANLACELPQSRDSIVEAGGIPRLLALLISGSAKIKAHALSAIAELALGNQKIQNLVGSDPNGIPFPSDWLACKCSPRRPSPPLVPTGWLGPERHPGARGHDYECNGEGDECEEPLMTSDDL
jgi:hypothetical protein